MPKLTKRTIDSLPPTASELFIWDDELPGFGLRIKPTGVRSFIVQYRNDQGRSRRMTFGRYGVLTPEEARKQARDLLAAVSKGTDPAGERHRMLHAPTVTQLCERYLADHVEPHNKPLTAREFRRLIEKFIKPQLGALKAEGVTRQDVVRLHRLMAETPRQANQTLAVLSKMFSLAELWGVRMENSNPCRMVKRYAETKRERFLSEPELARMGEALRQAEASGSEATNTCNAIRLLALSGCRVGEVVSLRWEHVDFENGGLHLADAKAGARVHPIGAQAIALLASIPRIEDSPWIFQGKRSGDALSVYTVEGAWQRIRAKAGLDDVRLHDLRHTVGTYAGQSGANAFLIRDKLGHKTLAMTGRYVNRDPHPLRTLRA